MLEKLKELIKKTMPEVETDGVNEETRLIEDLHFDSLGIMMLSMTLEDEFGISFDEPVMFSTVGDVVKYVQEKQK